MSLLKEKARVFSILSSSRITLSTCYVEAVNKFPQPKKLVDVQRFLGLANYFRKFRKDFARLGKLLQDLLRKNTVFDFNKDCLNTFNSLKEALTFFSILHLYNPGAETELHTDASSVALAVILLQKQKPVNGRQFSYITVK